MGQMLALSLSVSKPIRRLYPSDSLSSNRAILADADRVLSIGAAQLFSILMIDRPSITGEMSAGTQVAVWLEVTALKIGGASDS